MSLIRPPPGAAASPDYSALLLPVITAVQSDIDQWYDRSHQDLLEVHRRIQERIETLRATVAEGNAAEAAAQLRQMRHVTPPRQRGGGDGGGPPVSSSYLSTPPAAARAPPVAAMSPAGLASPQPDKVPLDTVLARFTSTNSPPINFDTLYEQLAGSEERSTSPTAPPTAPPPPSIPVPSPTITVAGRLAPSASHRGVFPVTVGGGGGTSPQPAARPIHMGAGMPSIGMASPLAGGAGGGGHYHYHHGQPGASSPSAAAPSATASIPIDSLMQLEGQKPTRNVSIVATENGRSLVWRPPRDASTTDDAVGFDLRAPCMVLVEFKRKRVLQFEADRFVHPGDYVIVGGDRGEDLGLVVFSWTETPEKGVQGLGLSGATLTRSIGIGSGKLLRRAETHEVDQLHGILATLENRAVEVCQQRVLESGLPMNIVDAEYQFDKKKLTFYYEAQQRLDFRELVRDLFKTFRARIWMEPATEIGGSAATTAGGARQ